LDNGKIFSVWMEIVPLRSKTVIILWWPLINHYVLILAWSRQAAHRKGFEITDSVSSHGSPLTKVIAGKSSRCSPLIARGKAYHGARAGDDILGDRQSQSRSAYGAIVIAILTR
jgi:hypothetical protein